MAHAGSVGGFRHRELDQAGLSGRWTRFSQQHLASWPPDADSVAFDDLALQLADPSALEPQRALLQSARRVGIDAAYRPSLAMQLLQEWIAADNEISRAMLQSRRDELLGEPVATAMRILLEHDPDDPALIANHAFLELARAGRDELAFQAAENPAQVSPALLDLALAGEADVFDALSTLITVAADTDAGRAPVYFYKAMALALRDRPEDAAAAVARARTLDATQVPAWLAQIVRLVGKYPQLIPLSQALIAQPSANGGD